VSGNSDDPDTVGHHDVLALPGDPKARLLQSPDGLLMGSHPECAARPKG
jgi:hypothetical protein